MQPLVHEEENNTFVLYEDDNTSQNDTHLSDGARYSNSTMSIFLLWLASNIMGWIFDFLQLPTLLGKKIF